MIARAAPMQVALMAALMAAPIRCARAQMPSLAGAPTDLAVLRFIDIAQGAGAPATAGKRFTVHYTGWLKDGTKFDSSVDRNEPFSFIQGRRQVIAGWDLGFEGMKAGGKRRLFVPYQLAYGEQGTGPIPPKAELIFDVELLAVSDPPAVVPAIDVLLPFTDLESKVIALAKAMPEEKYSSHAFGRIMMHIVNANQSLLEAGMKDAPGLEGMKADAEPGGKEQILALLTSSFAAVRKELETARAGSLSSDATLLGRATIRRGLFTVLDTIVGEQLGEAIAAAQASGVAIPATPSPAYL